MLWKKERKLNTNPQRCQGPGKPQPSDIKHNLEQSQFQDKISMLPRTTRLNFPKFYPCCPEQLDYSSSKLLDCSVLLYKFFYNSSLHCQARQPRLLSCCLLNIASCSESTSCLDSIAGLPGDLLSVFEQVSLYNRLSDFK